MTTTEKGWEGKVRKFLRDYDNQVRFSEKLATVEDFTEATLRAAKVADDLVNFIRETRQEAYKEGKDRAVDYIEDKISDVFEAYVPSRILEAARNLPE